MSVHSSMRTKGATASQRNVMKRHERVRHLMAQGLWPEGRSVLGLPKIKQLRIKSRKAAKEKPEEAAAAGEKAAEGSAATPPAK